MEHQKPITRIISVFLTMAMLCGLVPTAALAANEYEIPNIIEYKAMTLVDLQGGKWVSRYQYAKSENTFFGDVNLNVPSLLRIGFTIEKSQYISLALYKLDPSVVEHTGEDDHATLEYKFNPDAEDFGASEPEDFLADNGNMIGYICGTRVTDNIVNPSTTAEQVDYQRISDDEWRSIVESAVDEDGLINHETLNNMYAYGFKGEKLPPPPPPPETEAASLMSMDEDIVPVSDEQALDADMEMGEPVETLGLDVSTDEAVELPEDADLADDVTEDGDLPEDNDVEAEEPTVEESRSLLPISDVLYDPEPASVFSGRRRADPRAGDDWAIENYVLWDGTVKTPGGQIKKPNYEDGYYVIVMEPCREDASLYNSFLGFKSTTEYRRPFTMDGYSEPKMSEEEWLISYTKDPVNLLTGSFSWNYTDMALYGREDLPFIRYYESTAADKNYGLGNGWSTNFTADLTVKKFYAEVHLAKNRILYFDMDFDGEYRTCGDWTFAWNGSGYTLENTMANTAYTFNEDAVLTSKIGRAHV